MALPAYSFSNNNFFQAIRPRMDANRGLFAGADGGLRFVCMDAVFYRLEAFIRPNTQKFTTAATALDPSVRAVANGQMFGKKNILGMPNYNLTGPGPMKWHGEVIDGHTVKKGDPPSAPGFRYLGQWDTPFDGCREWVSARCTTSWGTPPRASPVGPGSAMGQTKSRGNSRSFFLSRSARETASIGKRCIHPRMSRGGWPSIPLADASSLSPGPRSRILPDVMLVRLGCSG
jgi:hypothetical protein